MINDAQRTILESIELPAPLQTMLDENIVDERLLNYYVASFPTRDHLSKLILPLRVKTEDELEVVARQTNLNRKKAMLGEVAAMVNDKLTAIRYPLAVMTRPFLKTDVFLQRTTAMSERQRTLWRARVASDKAATAALINELLATLRNDLKKSILLLEKQIRREQRRRNLKRLFRRA
jgi:hypothetical protein